MIDLKPLSSSEERRAASVDAFASAAGKAAALAIARGTTTAAELAELSRSPRTLSRFQNIIIGVQPSSHRPTKLKSKR